MNTSARLLLTAIAAIAVLSGCASHPELRPYTPQESRQLQLEAIQRHGLSLEEYELRKRVIERSANEQVITERSEDQGGAQG
ncbi:MULTISPECIES: hypothetical protein [Pseudomonas]|jgi:outer membrane biogenesis lipoprotein LolB|uniref:Lipoprotein n=1 Tax=Pseudomonas promysalinigenes TaxID=485898 RepID=A0ABY6AH40_9PSED|nr:MULTISPECIES: hypothetical protein [Pseudomonas]QXI31905.1 hypothetical protein HU725_012620 [Pseudomonas promysalinigenes]UXH38058.1 hypothetical protein N5C08_13720 [Pseudomonas promysalinigenes]